MKKTSALQSALGEKDRDELPEGWAEIELEDHIYIAGRIGWRGLKAEEYTPTGPILISVPNLNYGDEVNFSKVYHISDSRYDESPEIKLQVGDTLLVKDGAGIGKLGYVADLPGKATVNSSLLVVRPRDQLLSHRYLFYYLKGPRFQEIALQRITGSTTPHLFQKDIKQFKILVPPLHEQGRIAGRIAVFADQANACCGRLSKVPKILKAFRQSVLAAACCGRLTEDWRDSRSSKDTAAALLEEIATYRRRRAPKRYQVDYPVDDADGLPDSWAWSSVGNVTSHIADVDHRMPKPQSRGIPYISTKDFTDSGIDFDNAKRISSHDFELLSKKIRPEQGDLLLSRYGTIGEVRRVSTKIDFQVSYSVAIIKTLPVDGFTDWLHLCLLNMDAQRQMSDSIRASSQPDLGLEYIRLLRIPIAPVSEQHEIVSRVEALFKLANKIEERVAAATERADKLTQAMLAKAFRGELVPTEAELARKEGRDYESASILLERIKAERDKSDAATNATKRRLTKRK
ncbi:MAG TPA: restriction endonuclease subunit S [Bryobacteraceae bacterium]|nr:restriction endonuclease subunit S [Bryobacteraceae bacterium]